MKIPQANGSNNTLIMLMLAALFVRIGLAGVAYSVTDDRMIFHSNDSREYISTATSLLTEGKFERDGHPETLRTPGYPAFLMLGISLGQVEMVTIALQVLLSCLSVYLVFHIVGLLGYSNEAAIIAAALYALEPTSIVYSCMLLTETLYTTLLLTFIFLLFRYLRDFSLWPLVGAGLALSASAYVRPVSYYLPVLTAIVLIICAIMVRPAVLPKTRIVHIILFCTISLASLGIWQLRNCLVTGFCGFSSAEQVNLYFFFATKTLAEKEAVSFSEQQSRMVQEFAQQYPECAEALRSSYPANVNFSNQCITYLERDARTIIRENPLPYLKGHLTGSALTLFGPGSGAFLALFGQMASDNTWVLFNKCRTGNLSQSLRAPISTIVVSIVLMAALVFFLCSAMVGVVRCWLTNHTQTAILVMLIAYFVIIPGALGYSRYRHPCMPMISILAGVGAVTMKHRVAKIAKSVMLL